MARFLSAEWVDEMIDALNASAEVGAAIRGLDVTLQQVVTDAPGGEVRYWTRFADGTVSGGLGEADGADVTITQDHATAVALSRGELNAQAAFMQGKLSVGGNMAKLLQHQEAMRAIAPVLASLDVTFD